MRSDRSESKAYLNEAEGDLHFRFSDPGTDPSATDCELKTENCELILTPRNDPAESPMYRAVMFESLRQSDENPASSLRLLIVSLVAMSILFGFGLATFIFRLQTHTRPDAVIPAIVLSFAGLCFQFGMVRFLIRHLTQASN